MSYPAVRSLDHQGRLRIDVIVTSQVPYCLPKSGESEQIGLHQAGVQSYSSKRLDDKKAGFNGKLKSQTILFGSIAAPIVITGINGTNAIMLCTSCYKPSKASWPKISRMIDLMASAAVIE